MCRCSYFKNKFFEENKEVLLEQVKRLKDKEDKKL